MTILSISDLKSLMDVSFHKRDETITAAIEAVEMSYVKKYFKDDVYTFILKNTIASPSNTFADLIVDGGFYEDEDGKEYYINGLNKTIALLAYCDLLINQTVVTRFGAVNKNDSYSFKPEFSSILEQVSRYRKTALLYLQDIDTMLRVYNITPSDTDITDLLTAYRLECVGKIEGILNEWI